MVCDLGCGPGYILKILNQFFPDKVFTGIDSHQEFIEYAKTSIYSKNVEYLYGDIFEIAPDSQWDFVNARALVQHLPSVPDFLKLLKKITHQSSTVVIFDAPGDETFEYNFFPRFPLRMEIYRELVAAQKRKGGDRSCLAKIQEYAEDFGFQIKVVKDSYSPAVGNKDRDNVFFYLTLISELYDRMFDIDIDKKLYIEQLSHWYDSEVQYAQFPGQWIELVRV